MGAKQAFISYSHKDSTFVHTFAYLLKSLNFKIWIDYNIHAGYLWTDELKKHLDDSDVVILISSPHILDSDWVKEEIAYAKGKKKHIIPIMYNPSGITFDPPFGLNSIQSIDLSKQPNYWLDQIINQLEKHIGRETPNPLPTVVEVNPSEVLNNLLLNFTQTAIHAVSIEQLILFLSEKRMISQEVARQINHINTVLTIKENMK